jgi:hypothetical protein
MHLTASTGPNITFAHGADLAAVLTRSIVRWQFWRIGDDFRTSFNFSRNCSSSAARSEWALGAAVGFTG